MDEIIVDIELSDEIVVEVLQDDDITVTIEDADEIDVEAFDYPPEIDVLNQRVANCEQNTLNAVTTANSASELAVQSAQIAQSAGQSASEAAAAAGEATQIANNAAEAASNAQQTANQAAQYASQHAQSKTNPHPTDTTQEFTDAQITSLSAEATYTPTVWSYLVGLFTVVPKSVKEHLIKIWTIINAIAFVEPVTETETFTLALTHLYKGIRCNSATDMDCNIPLNDTVAFPVGSVISIQQIGNGVVTAKAVSGVTLNGDAKTAGQYKFIQLWKTDTNVWNVIGGVA
jgi:hypothetical protein